jgi:hypothetical protein
MNEEQVTETPAVEDNKDFTAETQETKTFTQEDLDSIVKERLSRERSKLLKKYEGVDVEKYNTLISEQEAKEQEEQAKRGEFEKILKSTVEKKDSVISQLQTELQGIKVDGNLLNAASSRKAVNPQQVVRLLKDQVRLTESGEVEVLDDGGSARYTDKGTAMSVEDLVEEFLTTNPHFKMANPGGTGSTSNVADTNGTPGKFDVKALDMNNPKDRALYKEHMKSKGVRV